MGFSSHSGPAHLNRLMNINEKDKNEKKIKGKKEKEIGVKRKYVKRKDKELKIYKKRRKLDSEKSSIT